MTNARIILVLILTLVCAPAHAGDTSTSSVPATQQEESSTLLYGAAATGLCTAGALAGTAVAAPFVMIGLAALSSAAITYGTVKAGQTAWEWMADSD